MEEHNYKNTFIPVGCNIATPVYYQPKLNITDTLKDVLMIFDDANVPKDDWCRQVITLMVNTFK